MYGWLLTLHSLTRWLLLAMLMTTVIRSWYASRRNGSFSRTDATFKNTTALLAVLQLVLGLWLYCLSPFVAGFFRNFPDSIHIRDFRFFGLEHITVMTLSLLFVVIAALRSVRKSGRSKHRMIAIWYSIAMVLIFLSVPWPFSPFTSRPWLRPFW